MRWWIAGMAVLATCCSAAQAQVAGKDELQARRLRAAQAFPDGVLLVRSRIDVNSAADGYRENATFYYLTGLENSPGAILAIDGKTRESWLFVHAWHRGAPLEAEPGDASAQKLGLQHVVDWTELDSFLTRVVQASAKIYCERETAELPPNLVQARDNHTPTWIQALTKKWPTLDIQVVEDQLSGLMNEESEAEILLSRAAARATVPAVMAGIRSIRPGISQRKIELAVESACWNAGAHGVSFWPWVMGGANGVFPKPFDSFTRYDHLDAVLQRGDLVRLDVGCEWQHYQGDLGRTVPVSGHYSEEQREIWNMFVAAYLAGVKELRPGNTEERVFDAWKAELLRHRAFVKSPLAKQAIETWNDRKNVPYWQIHTSNLDTGSIDGGLRVGMVIDFEPIVSIGGQGYYLEDMFLITEAGSELLTPGVPYTAEEIEAAMKHDQ